MKLYRGVISVVFFALAVYVFCLNMFATCFTSQDRFELNFYSGDIIILNVAAAALFVAAVLLIDWRRFAGFLEKHYDVIRIVLYILIALSALFLLFLTVLPVLFIVKVRPSGLIPVHHRS